MITAGAVAAIVLLALLAFFLLLRGDKVYVKKLFVSRPDRARIRARAAQTALELALRLAQGKTPAGTQVLAESAQHDPAALTALDETLRAE